MRGFATRHLARRAGCRDRRCALPSAHPVPGHRATKQPPSAGSRDAGVRMASARIDRGRTACEVQFPSSHFGGEWCADLPVRLVRGRPRPHGARTSSSAFLSAQGRASTRRFAPGTRWGSPTREAAVRATPRAPCSQRIALPWDAPRGDAGRSRRRTCHSNRSRHGRSARASR